MKVGGQILWNVTPICETSQIYLMGTPHERRLGTTHHSVLFIGWVWHHFCQKRDKNPSIWKESLSWIVPWIRVVRGWNLEEWRTGSRHWGVGNDGRIRKSILKDSRVHVRPCGLCWVSEAKAVLMVWPFISTRWKVITPHPSTYVRDFCWFIFLSFRHQTMKKTRGSVCRKYDGLLSMTKIPFDDILEGLCKLRTRESEKLQTVLELYNMEIHQKKAGPDDHRLKTMVKRSIEQDLWNKNFEARNGNYEKNAVVKNQGTKHREQRSFGDRWQWKANGLCSKSKEFAPIHSWKNGPEYLSHPRMDAEFLGKVHSCVSPGWRTAKQTFSQNGEQSAVVMLKSFTTIGLRVSGYWTVEVFIDFSDEFKNTKTNRMCSIYPRSRTSCRHIRPKSIVWNDFPGDPQQLDTNPPKFWVSVLGRDGKARAMCPWSSVEAGQKHPKIKGEKYKKHSSHLRKIGACAINPQIWGKRM